MIDFHERAVPYPFSDLDQITLAYATTIHKSQSSVYPAVVIPLTMQHYMMLQRNLVYTGVTRETQARGPDRAEESHGDGGEERRRGATVVEAGCVAGARFGIAALCGAGGLGSAVLIALFT